MTPTLRDATEASRGYLCSDHGISWTATAADEQFDADVEAHEALHEYDDEPEPERPTVVPAGRIAEGLRFVATMFDHGDIPALLYPGAPEQVHLLAATETGVRELAARLGVEVRQHATSAGAVHTSFEYPAAAGALVLRVVHIQDAAS